SSRSPGTTRTEGGRREGVRPRLRTVTSWPRATARATQAVLMFPVPPRKRSFTRREASCTTMIPGRAGGPCAAPAPRGPLARAAGGYPRPTHGTALATAARVDGGARGRLRVPPRLRPELRLLVRGPDPGLPDRPAPSRDRRLALLRPRRGLDAEPDPRRAPGA